MQPQYATALKQPGATPPLAVLPVLDTPDPLRFPLTSRYQADGTELRPAAVYLRESEKDQGKWSFETQYERAREVLARHGYYVAMVRLDAKSGSKVSRSGYQDVALAVQYGLIEAVGVYMMARWGRRASERLRIGEEFDRLNAVVMDAQRGGPDKPGMLRAVMAGYDEQFLRDLSQKAVDNMPKAAAAGKHAAPTPVGYKRVYPEAQPYDRHVPSVMVDDEVYGPLIREVFQRCARGQSIRSIVAWLNSRPGGPNPRSKTGRWYDAGVARLLRRRVYRQYEDTEHGEIEWGKEPSGDWNHYTGEVIHAEGQHPWLVDAATWDAAQARLDGAARTQTLTQRSTVPSLLWGVLLCPACGAPMTPHKETTRGPRRGRYVCSTRERRSSDKGAPPCTAPGISFAVAEGAVLRELMRLEGKPWQPQAMDALEGRDPHAAARTQLRGELAVAEAALARNVVALRELGQLSQEVLDAFRADAQALGACITAAKEQLAALPAVATNAQRARELHERLRQTDVRAVVTTLSAQGDTVGLREVLLRLVASATIAERQTGGPGGRSVWARAAVTWSDDVQALREAGLLALGPAPEPPAALDRKGRNRERMRRWRAVRRAAHAPVDNSPCAASGQS